MKRFLLFTALFCSHSAFAQQPVTTQTHVRIISGNSPMGRDVIRPMLASVTDKTIYDENGKVVDSAAAKELLRTFKYQMSITKPPGQTEMKRTITKVDPIEQEKLDNITRFMARIENPKLWEGAKLDLSPLTNRTDISRLDGKAVVLIFWRNVNPVSGIRSYAEINEVIAKHYPNHKFEVFAITGLPYNEAKDYTKINPILNAHQVIDAEGITQAYELQDKIAIVITDANHVIKYGVTDFLAMTPRTLNKLLDDLE